MKREHFSANGGESEYTELEYIQNTAKAYIDTGIAGNQNLCIEAEYMITSNLTNVDCLIAVDQPGNYWFCSRNGNNDRFRIYSSSYIFTTQRKLNVKRYTIMNNASNQVIVDGSVIGTFSSIPTFTSATLYLFGDHTTSGMQWQAGARIYYVKMYNKLTNEVYREFIPAKRNSDGVVGLYDTVTQTLFTNQETGEFIYA